MSTMLERRPRHEMASVSGIRDIARRLRTARDGFNKMEKDLDRILSYKPSRTSSFARIGCGVVAGTGTMMVAAPFAAFIPIVGVFAAPVLGMAAGAATAKLASIETLKKVTGVIPFRGLSQWVNSLSDPLAIAERATRTHANDLQEGVLGLKKVTEELWEDQGRIAEVLAQAERENWSAERLFEFVLEEAAAGNLPIDAEVAELMQERQGRLSEGERSEFSRRIKESIREYLGTVDKLVEYVGSVGDEALDLLGKVVLHYVQYARLRPVVSELRNMGLAMTSASEGVFASRDLLIRHLQASQEAFMAAADAAEAMDKYRIAGPEVVKMLQQADRQLSTRLKALRAPRERTLAVQQGGHKELGEHKASDS